MDPILAGLPDRDSEPTTAVVTRERLAGEVHLRAARYGGHPSPDADVSSHRKEGLPSVARSQMKASEGWYRYGDLRKVAP